MNCSNCGSDALIKAHLIPRAFCVEVQTGKSHAASVTKDGNFVVNQSGVWDRNILCNKCDGRLGDYEQYAHRVAQEIRSSGSSTVGKTKIVAGVDNIKILRFCAGILYKYSLTTKANGRIDLGRYQEVLRTFIFDPSSPVPSELDALIVRPLRYDNDTGVFAYRAPAPDRQNGVNVFRMMMGGLIFIVQLDKRTLSDGLLSSMLIRGCAEGLPFATVAAADFEEFTTPRELAHSNERLSTYLDKNP